MKGTQRYLLIIIFGQEKHGVPDSNLDSRKDIDTQNSEMQLLRIAPHGVGRGGLFAPESPIISGEEVRSGLPK